MSNTPQAPQGATLFLGDAGIQPAWVYWSFIAGNYAGNYAGCDLARVNVDHGSVCPFSSEALSVAGRVLNEYM